MADVLGDALQKLSVTRAPAPPDSSNSDAASIHPLNTLELTACFSPMADQETNQPVTDRGPLSTASGTHTFDAFDPVAETAASSPSEMTSSLVTVAAISFKDPESESISVASADGRPGVAESERPDQPTTPPSIPRTSRWDGLSVFVSERRRQIAAAVVIVCMAGLWFDESGSSNSTLPSADMLSEDFADVEAALSEFDVKAAPPMREPAEPVDASAPPGFDLSIPGEQAFSKMDSEAANSSNTTASYPDASGVMEIPATPQSTYQPESAGSSPSTGFSAAPVSVPSGKGRNVRARLSRSIQPVH